MNVNMENVNASVNKNVNMNINNVMNECTLVGLEQN